MHCVEVTLVNADGLRLSMGVSVPFHATAYENAARDEAAIRANADAFHTKYGPWLAHTSKFIY